jgi:glutamine synthetase adenylyltransferase
VAGNEACAGRLVEKVCAACQERFSSCATAKEEMRRMRRRLETEVMVPPSNTKTAAGGYYDADFVVSFLRLREGIALAPATCMLDQIAALARAGLLGEAEARTLAQGASFLRFLDHAVRLVTGKALAGLPEHVGHAEAVADLARRWGLVESGQSLADKLSNVQREIRRVYRLVFGPEAN